MHSNLATRESAKRLFPHIIEENISILDFSTVQVISRSFANEFLILEKKYNLQLEKKNMSVDVKKMFENASKTLDSNILEKNEFSVISGDKYENLI